MKLFIRQITVIFLLVASYFLLVTSIHAQTALPFATTDPGQKYGITYPVPELGGCTGFSSCRSYCEDPVHQDACIAFAKTKGFYKEDAATVKAKTLLDAAKVELGCDSFDDCKTFCESNKDKCDGFAKSHNLGGGNVDDLSKATIIQQAKAVLGCNSEDSCKSFCSQVANQQKCSEFAQSVGLKGGKARQGPGGCSSEESCRTFCLDPKNFDQCQHAVGSGSQFQGPGGCSSKASCQAYCQTHQNECKLTSDNQTAPIDPKAFVDFCKTSPDKCMYSQFCKDNSTKCQTNFVSQGLGTIHTDMGGCKTPGECYDWCQTNADKCPGFNPNIPRPDDSQYKQYIQIYDPQTACKRGGCTWSNNSCQCPSSGYNYQKLNYDPTKYPCPNTVCSSGFAPDPSKSCACIPTPSGGYNSGSNNPATYTGNTTSYGQQEASCKASGGVCAASSTSTFCNCQISNSSSQTQPTSNSGSSYAPCPNTVCSSGFAPDPSKSCACAPSQYGGGSLPTQNTLQQTSSSTPAPASSPAVRGVSTSRGLLQILLDLFVGR